MLEKIKRKLFKVAIYIRLSKEDIDRGYDESESIINQRILLTEYVEKLGPNYDLVDIYIDLGYTGTNFNRPDFKRMISDIKNGKINMVVTKDLSRLGRDYIETGEYIEKWFPERNIRYVSVNDGIDTFADNNGNNDIAPFKSILNDMYSKDLSKKIRTALHTMQKQGKWVASSVALGYMKDPNEKNKLVICEKEAEIVRIIFNMAYQGNKLYYIRDYLNKNKIPTRNQIRYNKATFWENKAIKTILTNKVYIGVSEQNKQSRINYKNRKIRKNPKEEWLIVENTHEPIIEREVFDAVQKMETTQKYLRNSKKYNFLLDGLLICFECKHKIGIKIRKTADGDTFDMVCNNYRRNSKLKLCTSHGFNYNKLEKMVIEYVRNMFNDIDDKKILLNVKNNQKKYDYNKVLTKLQQEIDIIYNNMDNMYIDKLNKKITEDMYLRLYNKLQEDVTNKEKEYKELLEEKEKDFQDDDEKIEKIIKEFLSLERPTPELMRMIINRIEIHQDRQVDIIFNFKKLNKFFNNNCLI